MLPGMTATLRIITDERTGALRVPNAALRWRPPGQGAAPGQAAAPANPMEAALREMTDLTPAQRQEVEAAGLPLQVSVNLAASILSSLDFADFALAEVQRASAQPRSRGYSSPSGGAGS